MPYFVTSVGIYNIFGLFHQFYKKAEINKNKQ